MALDTRIEDGVLILTLNDPARRNPLDLPTRYALHDALAAAETDPAVGAIVLTGAGGNFCSGGDLAAQAKVSGPLEARDRHQAAVRLVKRMVRNPKPLVAAVEGWAAGAGLSLAIACDVVVAARPARFIASFVRVGLLPDLGLLATLPARVGPATARRMMLDPEAVDAEQAQRLGLVDDLADEGGALAAALARARAMAGGAPLARLHIKDFMARQIDEALDYELTIQPLLMGSADAVEGRAAFFEKRQPQFRGK